jgi:hypothetical protein
MFLDKCEPNDRLRAAMTLFDNFSCPDFTAEAAEKRGGGGGPRELDCNSASSTFFLRVLRVEVLFCVGLRSNRGKRAPRHFDLWREAAGREALRCPNLRHLSSASPLPRKHAGSFIIGKKSCPHYCQSIGKFNNSRPKKIYQSYVVKNF